MKFSSRQRAVAAFLLAFATPVSMDSTALAMDSACTIENKKFVCADGSKNSKDVLAALANPQTVRNVEAVDPGNKLFANPQESERYRRSVERARRSAKYYADLSFRQFKRRRITLKEYKVIQAEFNKAMDHYRAALVPYHSTQWFSTKRDKNAEGDE